MILHSFIFYLISLHGIACHFIALYGIAWYCIVFGFFARYRTVMYRCYSAPANYRVVHLVILLSPKHSHPDLGGKRQIFPLKLPLSLSKLFLIEVFVFSQREIFKNMDVENTQFELKLYRGPFQDAVLLAG